MNKESDFVIEAVDFLAVGVELDIDAIFEGLEFGGREKRSPIAGFANAVGDF